MAKPKPNPVAVRLPADLEAQIVAHMAETGRKRNLAIVQLLRLGLEAHAGVPKYTIKPPPRSVVSRARWNLSGVQLGPVDAPPGSRLKGANKAPSRSK